MSFRTAAGGEELAFLCAWWTPKRKPQNHLALDLQLTHALPAVHCVQTLPQATLLSPPEEPWPPRPPTY